MFQINLTIEERPNKKLIESLNLTRKIDFPRQSLKIFTFRVK